MTAKEQWLKASAAAIAKPAVRSNRGVHRKQTWLVGFLENVEQRRMDAHENHDQRGLDEQNDRIRNSINRIEDRIMVLEQDEKEMHRDHTIPIVQMEGSIETLRGYLYK